MAQLLYPAQFGSFDLKDAAIAAGQPVSDESLMKIASTSRFAAVRPELIFMGYFHDGDTVPTPASPVDGYLYSRDEVTYFYDCYSNRAITPDFLAGQALPPHHASSQPAQLYFAAWNVNDTDGVVRLITSFWDTHVETLSNTGILKVTAVCQRSSVQGLVREAGVTSPGGNPAVLSLTSVSPNSGAAGQRVVLLGTGFQPTSVVTFGGALATGGTLFGSTQISIAVPAGVVGTAVEVRVTNRDGSNASLPGGFTYTSTPVTPTLALTSVSPSSGSPIGGTNITLTGDGFAAGATVTVGGTAAISVVVTSQTTITARTPSGSVGSTAVAVTVGTNTATLNSSFTYISSPPPPPPPPSVIFSDDFELGDFSRWSLVHHGTGSAPPACNHWAVQGSTVQSGSNAAQCHYCLSGVTSNTDDNNFLEKAGLNLTHFFARGYVRIHFNSGSSSDYQRKLIFCHSLGGGGAELYDVILTHWTAGFGGLAVITQRPGAPQGVYRANRSLSLDVWHSVEMEVRVNDLGSSNGAANVWLDGVQVISAGGLDMRGPNSANINTIDFGTQVNLTGSPSGQSADEYRYWDSIVIASSRIGP